jgi:hypothetical protein
VTVGLGDAGGVRVVAKISGRDGDELSAATAACWVHVGKEWLAVLGGASGENGGEGEEAEGEEAEGEEAEGEEASSVVLQGERRSWYLLREVDERVQL